MRVLKAQLSNNVKLNFQSTFIFSSIPAAGAASWGLGRLIGAYSSMRGAGDDLDASSLSTSLPSKAATSTPNTPSNFLDPSFGWLPVCSKPLTDGPWAYA